MSICHIHTKVQNGIGNSELSEVRDKHGEWNAIELFLRTATERGRTFYAVPSCVAETARSDCTNVSSELTRVSFVMKAGAIYKQ